MFSCIVFSLLFAFFSISAGFPSTNSNGVDEYGPNIDEQGIWFGGDILGFSGKNGEITKWPNNTIVYRIDKKFSQDSVNMIHDAMTEISEKTCIRFKQRTNEYGFANFYSGLPGMGCRAFVGKMDWLLQPVILEPKCLVHGTIIHEIMHTIGFEHEQNRKDRDTYVDIHFENIIPGMEFNFKIGNAELYDVPYDYDSVMHYSKFHFSKNGLPTIITKPNEVPIGKREDMSPSDALKVNRMYECENL